MTTETAREFEKVPFRLLRFACCGFLCCWVNPRIPTYCPECGAASLVSKPETRFYDPEAFLEVHQGV